MKAKDILIPAGLILGWLVYSKHRAIGVLNYLIAGVNLKFSGITPILIVDLAVQNVTNESFEISSVVGSLYSNNIYVGNVSTFDKITVLPASQTVITLNIRMSISGIVSDIVNIITQGHGVRQNILFQGYINASGIIAPLNLNYVVG